MNRLRPQVRIRVAVAAHALLCILRPGDPQCAEWEQVAIRHARRADDDDAWLAIGVTAAARILWLGAPARPIIELSHRIDAAANRRTGSSSVAWTAAKLHCALVFADPGLWHDAPAVVGAVEAALERGGVDDKAQALALHVRELVRGRLEEAGATLRSIAAQTAHCTPYDAWLLSFHKVWLSIEAGDAETALIDASGALAVAERSAVPHAIAWAKFALARALASGPRSRRVWRHLADARHAAHRVGNRPLVALCRLAAALHALHHRKHRQAAGLARHGLQAIEESSLFRPPMFSRRDLETLFRAADAQGASPAGALRAFHGICAATDRVAVRQDVEIRCLGSFSIRRGGRLLEWPRKPPRRSLELLKALVANGREGVPVSRLTGMLWPALDGDHARKAFATALYRLRGVLGNGTLVLNAGRLHFDPKTTWIDAHAFEAAVLGGACTRADIELHAGVLLADEDEPWILPARARLRELHRSAVCNMGERMLEEGRWREALDLYTAALQRDGLAEVFFQQAIAACIAGGLRAEASALYEQCRNALSDHLGLSPSRNTEALYREAIRNRS